MLTIVVALQGTLDHQSSCDCSDRSLEEEQTGRNLTGFEGSSERQGRQTDIDHEGTVLCPGGHRKYH